MSYKRSSGILLHPTSLPGPDGIGDLGPSAYHWVNFLSQSGCTRWQVLPLGPTGYGDSPYQSFSAFAGNPLLISPALLLEDGLLEFEDLNERPVFPPENVEFAETIKWKNSLLTKAYDSFYNKPNHPLKTVFDKFKINNNDWLGEYSLFMAIKGVNDAKPWNEWPVALRDRDPNQLQDFKQNNTSLIESLKFGQFLFFQQWGNLHNYARQKGIEIIGDIPIFIAYDSSDAWSHPDLFSLNPDGSLDSVAGVPPDYFSPTGQLWGNPLYIWENHQSTGFQWWIKRIQWTLNLVDFIRLDHFRGFAAYWEIPSGALTAEKGKWKTGPGAEFFSELIKKIQKLPIIAEDLGEITPDVIELRDNFDFPGMKILQFAFSGNPDNPFLPHNYPRNCVAYTGTHDNDTCIGWYNSTTEKEKDFFRRYLSSPAIDISWEMIRAIWASPADLAIAPLQDFLNLDSHARMNFPGKVGGNWAWRYPAGALTPQLSERIQELNYLFSRNNNRELSDY